jgi:hypothetical protein
VSERVYRGSCLCGACSYEVRGPLRNVIACHCGQCRKQTGHFMAATSANLADFRLLGETTLRWYRASARARRGFCASCGSTLFWQADGAAQISIAAGTLDGATGLRIEGHIYCADRGDYYSIPDEGYRYEQWH